jgi:hypothetical protein
MGFASEVHPRRGSREGIASRAPGSKRFLRAFLQKAPLSYDFLNIFPLAQQPAPML